MTNLAILIVSLAGIFVANKIRIEKKSKQPMICPLDGKCETVLQTKYAKFINVPLEYAGLIYYFFIFASYLAFVMSPDLQNGLFGLIVTVATTFGLLFSVYLTIVQWKIIKSWCTWCLLSAFTSTAPFFGSFFSFFANFDLVKIINQNIETIFIFDIFIVAFATSTVLVTEFLHLKFLKDFRINEQESIVLMYLWQIIWVLIFVITANTVAFELVKNNPEIVISVLRPFKLVIVFILSAVSSLYLLPKMTRQGEKINCLNIKFIIPARLSLISICAILIPTWIMLPASNIELYLISVVIFLLVFNALTMLIDNFSKVKARS